MEFWGWDLVNCDGIIVARNPIGLLEFNTEKEVKEAIRKVKRAGGSYTKIVELNENERNNTGK